MGGHGLVVAGDQHHAIVRMGKRVNLHHRGHDVPGDERVAHAHCRLDHTVADVADREDARLAARLVHAVADLFDKATEVKRAGVAHAVGAVDQDLRLAKVFFGPVHAQAKSVPLVVHQPEPLAPQRLLDMGHVRPPLPLTTATTLRNRLTP
jgi:hypothetical protein